MTILTTKSDDSSVNVKDEGRFTIHEFITRVQSVYPDPYLFKTGECAALALAMYNVAMKTHSANSLSIVILYRLERDLEDDSVTDKVISHVMLGVDNDTFDIDGNNADERWNNHIDTIEPYRGNYNDTDYKVISGSDIENETLEACREYSMPFDTLSKLKELSKQ